MATVLGVVLCGGTSSRMGRDKAKIELASGMNFLEHAVERLKPVCDEVCLAGRSHWNDSLVALPDPTPNRGPIFGVLEAIRYAMQRHHACLITPVDMPHLTCHDLQKLVSGWQTDDRLTYAVSQPDQKVQPLVGVYPIHLHDSIAQHATFDASLTRWINSQPATVIALEESHCQNINHPEDLT